MCVKHLFAKCAFLGDLGECHHLEIATLRLHLGSGSVFRQRCKYSAILFNDCSIRVFIAGLFYWSISIILYLSMNKTCYDHCHSALRTTYQLGLQLVE